MTAAMMQAFASEDPDPAIFLRSSWPYEVGAIGGLVFALGSLFLMSATLWRAGPELDVALVAMGVGATLMTIGWGAQLRYGTGGVGPLFGSAACAAGMVFVWVYRHDHNFDHLRVTGAVLVLSFFAIAIGHLFARRMIVARVGAAIALVAFLLGISVLALGGLALVGAAVSLQLPAQRYATT